MSPVWQEEQRLARLKTLKTRIEAEIRSIETSLRRRATHRPAESAPPAATVPAKVIRTWLVEQGHQMGTHGRISHELRQEYLDAHAH